jgi:hypothetical protein
VECDICGAEVDNSEDLAKHKEKMHAVAETDEPEKEESPKVAEKDDVTNPAPIIPGRM